MESCGTQSANHPPKEIALLALRREERPIEWCLHSPSFLRASHFPLCKTLVRITNYHYPKQKSQILHFVTFSLK